MKSGPRERWARRRGSLTLAAIIGVLVGVTAGLGAYTFVYAKGASYLGHDSRACANCHVMNDQYDGWNHSSHRLVAGCNDCHAPHALLPKLAVKALNGFNHSFAFTTGRFHEPIQMGTRNRRITEGACRSCHAALVAEIDSHGGPDTAGALQCTGCHRNVGHLH
jgi:cytochrome c nitrite reductase small subunit